MTLETALRDGRPVQWVAELHGTDRATGAGVIRYYTLGVNYDGGTVEAPARITRVSPLEESIPIEDPLRLAGLVTTNAMSLELDTSPLGAGQAGALRDEIEGVRWDGGQASLWLAPLYEAWSSAQELVRTTTRGEPEWQGERLYRFELQSPAQLLGVPVEIASHVGIPTGWQSITTISATNSDNAAYNVHSYAVALRFRAPNGISVSHNIFQRDSGVNTDRQFSIDMNAAGAFQFEYSSGGTGFAFLIGSGAGYDDGKWHYVFCSPDPGRHAYLMIDGEVVAEDSNPPTPDLPTGGCKVNTREGSVVCDLRMYPSYIPPEEARTEMGTRSDSPRAILMVRCEDGAGSTLTDSSATANSMTAAGAEGVNWRFAPTDLGEPELAGRPYPLVGGLVVHAPAHLVHAADERYRVADIAPPEQLDMRSRGDVIAASGWTDEGEGVIEWSSAQQKPVTQSRRGDTPSSSHLGTIAQRLITGGLGGWPSRGGPNFDNADVERLDDLLPYEVGYFSDGRPSVAEIGAELVGGAGGYLAPGPAWRVGLLMPPVGPGPIAGDPGVLEFLGNTPSLAPSALFGDVANLPTGGSFSLGLWYKTFRVDPDPDAASPATPGNQQPGQILATKLAAGVDGYSITILSAAGEDPRSLSITIPELSVKEVRTPPVAVWGEWCLVLVVRDLFAGKLEIYHAVAGATDLELVSTTGSVTGTTTGNVESLRIGSDGLSSGGLHGSAAHFRIWNKALSATERLNVLDPTQGTEATPDHYAPLTEGEGSPVETTSGASAILTGVGWVPEAVIDLQSTARLAFRRTLRPARLVRMGYARNYRVLTDADMSGSVTDAERELLGRPIQWVPIDDPGGSPQLSRDFAGPWLDSTGARAAARIVAHRLQGQHYLAGVADYDLRGALLTLGRSEVRLVHPELDPTQHWRLIARGINPTDDTTSGTFWR